MVSANPTGHLEPELSIAIRQSVVGFVGLSGGGSHHVQQMAHHGFHDQVLYDPKVTEWKHLTRLVGAGVSDAEQNTPKTVIAERTVRRLHPHARIRCFQDVWQKNPDPLKECDVILAGVDSFMQRRDLEAFARRHCIPLIDVGMFVFPLADGGSREAGQVILSHPGRPCMWCMGFLTQELLDREGAEYGQAGSRPQVVNINATLAACAVGLAIDLLTGKPRRKAPASFFQYDGEDLTLTVHRRWPLIKDAICPHYAPGDVGDFRPVRRDLLPGRGVAGGIRNLDAAIGRVDSAQNILGRPS